MTHVMESKKMEQDFLVLSEDEKHLYGFLDMCESYHLDTVLSTITSKLLSVNSCMKEQESAKRNLIYLSNVLQIRYFMQEHGTLPKPDNFSNLYEDITSSLLDLLEDKTEFNYRNIHTICRTLRFSLLLMNENSFLAVTRKIILNCTHSPKTCTPIELHNQNQNFEIMPTVDNSGSDIQFQNKSPETCLHIILALVDVMLARPINFEVASWNVDEICQVVLQLVLMGNTYITAQCLICLVPKLLHFPNCKLLKEIWQMIIDNEDKPESLEKFLLVLCSLAEFYLSANTESTINLMKENKFWEILQNALSSGNSLMKKRALYLTKRSIEIITNTEIALSFPPETLCLWNKQEQPKFCDIWKDIFLVFDILEDEQVHLIKPVFGLISNLKKACNSKLHVSWLLCIYKQMLNSGSNAVIKLMIKDMTTLNISIFADQNKKYLLTYFKILFEGANNSPLYARSTNMIVLEQLRYLFQSVSDLSSDVKEYFFTSLLSELVNINWGPVPLFYFIHSLCNISKYAVWGSREINHLKILLLEQLGNKNVMIRCAIQCSALIVLPQFTKSDTNLMCLMELFGSLSSVVLKRGTGQWNDIAVWLSSFILSDSAYDFLIGSIERVCDNESSSKETTLVDLKSLSRFIAILTDANVILQFEEKHTFSERYKMFCKSIQKIISVFKLCKNRFYIDDHLLHIGLELVVHLILESESAFPLHNDLSRRKILDLICPSVSGIIEYIFKKLDSVSHIDEYSCVNYCMKALNAILSVNDNYSCAEILQRKALKNVMENGEQCPMLLYFSVKVLALISEWISLDFNNRKSLIISQKEYVSTLLNKDHFNNILIRTEYDRNLSREKQLIWGKLVSEYYDCLWTIICVHVSLNFENYPVIHWCVLLENAHKAIEGGRHVLVPIIKTFKILIPYILEAGMLELVTKFVCTCWMNIFELRKSDMYLPSVKVFVSMILQGSVTEYEEMHRHIFRFADEIITLGESTTGLTNILTCALQENIINCTSFSIHPYLSLLSKLIIFGPVHKHQRIENETCNYIKSHNSKLTSILTSHCSNPDGEVRIRASMILLHIVENLRDQKILNDLIMLLIEEDKQTSLKRPRYFGDSSIHRIKHRILQALLIMEAGLDEKNSDLILNWVCTSLNSENQQLSVRYQQEWLVIRILYHHKDLRKKMWTIFEKAHENRVGSLCSFISIIYHLACILTDQAEQLIFIDQSIQEILPWCMGQNFNVRLYAQVVLQKLWNFCERNQYISILDKYDIIHHCLRTSLSQAAALKNAQKLSEDFYFTAFQPIEHYSLETIFHDLPRLSNITSEEWVTAEIIKDCSEQNLNMKVENKNCSLKSYQVADWVLKCKGTSDEEFNLECQNVQRKINPWKSMLPDLEIMQSVSEAVMKRKNEVAKDGLVVVASLIDKLPNLGGLCRTCEVFGASAYVISSLKYTEDKQFQSLSVTSEKWLPIHEVKPFYLIDYLKVMKQEGYTIIGAEQTSNSVLLKKLLFPKKSLILLGNEKEGIPVTLLPLLDICVEIPQQGVIRSLNVHVTGAIFIWEYAKQHSSNS